MKLDEIKRIFTGNVCRLLQDGWYADSSEEFESIKQKRNERRDASKIFDKKLGERCNRMRWGAE